MPNKKKDELPKRKKKPAHAVLHINDVELGMGTSFRPSKNEEKRNNETQPTDRSDPAA